MNENRADPEIEYRVIGPPGCGKTTWLGSQVENAVENGRRVLITSQTRAAAAEIGGRRLPLPEENLGTLHSHCFKALGHPELAQGHLEEWNERHPALRLTAGGKSDVRRKMDGEMGESAAQTDGDRLMADYAMARSRMRISPYQSVRDFGALWEEWKRENGLLDFQDLIEVCLREVEEAPGQPDVIFVDEAQDLDNMEMRLIRRWGANAGYLVVVGDPDQCIYHWRGASPNAFINPALPEDRTLVLSQSYRVPVEVHRAAVQWINQVPDRPPVEYYPRDHPGVVRSINASWKYPNAAVADAEKLLEQGRSVMFLTTCAYMLDELIKVLRETALPFHNPYRRTNGAWNPLAFRSNSTPAAQRILAFLSLSRKGSWTAWETQKWSESLDLRGYLARGARKEIKELTDADEMGVDWETLNRLFTPEVMEAGLSGNLEWFESRLSAGRLKGAQYPLHIARRRGPETLEKPPGAIVGTIHSTKGGEVDAVYLFPDLSPPGHEEWVGSAEQRASIQRLFYVGMTRARESLILCQPSSKTAVSF